MHENCPGIYLLHSSLRREFAITNWVNVRVRHMKEDFFLIELRYSQFSFSYIFISVENWNACVVDFGLT